MCEINFDFLYFIQEQYAIATKLAKEHKGQILFVSIDTDEEDHKRILEFFGMKDDELPGMRIIKLAEVIWRFFFCFIYLYYEGMETKIVNTFLLFTERWGPGNYKMVLVGQKNNLVLGHISNKAKLLLETMFFVIIFTYLK